MKSKMLWITILCLGMQSLFAAGQETGLGSCANGKIAITAYDRESTYLLYTINPDGSDRQLIIRSTRQTFNWSPDACYVAYLLHREGTIMEGQYDAYLMDVTTSEVFRLTTTGYNSPPVWSPDGSRVAFAAGEEDTHTILIAEVEDILNGNSTFNTLIGDRAFNHSPMWSPDGSEIAFQSCTDTPFREELNTDMSSVRCDVYVANSNGRNAQNITQNLDADTLTFEWSPDSQRIAFIASYGYEDNRIYIVDVAEPNLLSLTDTFTSLFSTLKWSPDGNQIAFAARLDRDFDIYLVNPDGSDLTNLTIDIETQLCCNLAGFYGFDWSPDGTQIIFDVSPIEGYFDIFVMASDGSNVQPLTYHEFEHHYTHAVWLRP